MKKLFVVILLVCLGISVFASFSYSPAVDGFLGGAFLHPTADYLKTCQGKTLPSFRTSFTVGFDAMAANFKFGTFEVGAGYSMFWTSQSLAAGIHVIQPYYGLGFSVGANKRFEKGFGIGLKGRLFFCKYKPYNYKFDVIEVEAVPSFKVMEKKGMNIYFMSPVTCSIKSDAVTMKVQAGFRIQYNVNFSKKSTEEAVNEKV